MREKKNAEEVIHIKTTKALKEDLQKVSEITGRTMTDIITTALNKELAKYRNLNGSGRVEPVPAYRLSGISEYEKRIARKETGAASAERHDCLVLNDVTINARQPYYKIYDCESEQIVTVQKEQIKFKD